MDPSLYAALVTQLTFHENVRLFPYTDTQGQLTIGVGRNLTTRGISRSESRVLLDADIALVETDLNTFAWFSKLIAQQQLAMLDMRFNVGATGFREFHQMLLALAAGDYQMAAHEMLSSRWATQVGSRARTLARMMQNAEVSI